MTITPVLCLGLGTFVLGSVGLDIRMATQPIAEYVAPQHPLSKVWNRAFLQISFASLKLGLSKMTNAEIGILITRNTGISQPRDFMVEGIFVEVDRSARWPSAVFFLVKVSSEA